MLADPVEVIADLAAAAKACAIVQLPVSAGTPSTARLAVIQSPGWGDTAVAFRVTVFDAGGAGGRSDGRRSRAARHRRGTLLGSGRSACRAEPF